MPPDKITFVPSSTGKFDGKSKSAVYSHVARSTHQRRRKQQQIARTQSVLAWQRRDGPNQAAGTITQTHSLCGMHGLARVAGCVGCRSANEASGALSAPMLLPHKGNADPFDAQYIQIDPTINRYIDIGFNALDIRTWSIGYRVTGAPRGWAAKTSMTKESTPAHYIYGSQLDSSTILTTQEWSSTHAYAVLSYIAGAVYGVTGNERDYKNALEYSTRSISGLRHCFFKGVIKSSFRPEELVLRLIKAEMLAGRFESADIHAAFLEDWLHHQWRAEALDRGLLTRLLFQTNHNAVALWRRPRFDPVWLEDVFARYWQGLTDLDLIDEQFRRTLSQYVADEHLRQIFACMRVLFLQTAAFTAGKICVPVDCWYWLMSRQEWLQIRLLSYLQDYTQETFNTTPDGFVLAVAGLLALRFRSCDDSFFGDQPLFRQSKWLLERLRVALMQSTALQEEDSRSTHIWLTFVGALVEHRHRKLLMQEAQYGFWKLRLVHAIEEARLPDWTDLQEVLRLFPYTEEELPLPSTGWLDDAFG